MKTTVGYSEESARGDRTVGLRLYDRCEIALSGPGTFVDAAVGYLWPQARPVSVHASLPLIRLVPGRIPSSLTADAARRPITLYSSTDGRVPDYNEGVEYQGVPGLDRLVVNPHTGSRILVSGSKVHVVNTDTEAGARDALRVVKQLVTTEFEAAGVVTVHASAFAVADGAVAVVGPPGAGKTSTVLAAIATGARMIANDKVYASTDAHGTRIRGWTDPIRVIEAPGAPKRTVTLAAYFTEDLSRLAVDPLQLRTVVAADVGTRSVPVRCEELDPAAGLLSLRCEVLPRRVRWLGTEPPAAQRPLLPSADRFLRLAYGYHDAARAMELLLRHLDA
ncbi:hypothetical protein TK78_01015 [Streptomyces sp. Tue 6075]|uniref:hypothetical protein n=1 Tax=Streptomyces sp. Tue 6075 TaxID=1661694 RepID=UPI00094A29DD|nr:hypothetical protein [Streptomyces sp. Tue 6075]APS17666.1 hypothetical protein TK78_01015 [Streptomyces sp. Tue 6075]